MSEPAGPADILIVDDDPVARLVLREILEQEGYALAVAEQGGQGLSYLRSHALPRLVLLDLVMPFVDGWAFLRERQRRPALSPVPVVVFSAGGWFEGADPLELGAAEVLLKPFDLAKVLDVARRYCRAGTGVAV